MLQIISTHKLAHEFFIRWYMLLLITIMSFSFSSCFIVVKEYSVVSMTTALCFVTKSTFKFLLGFTFKFTVKPVCKLNYTTFCMYVYIVFWLVRLICPLHWVSFSQLSVKEKVDQQCLTRTYYSKLPVFILH